MAATPTRARYSASIPSSGRRIINMQLNTKFYALCSANNLFCPRSFLKKKRRDKGACRNNVNRGRPTPK